MLNQMLVMIALVVLALNLVSYWSAASQSGEGASQIEKLLAFECGLEPIGESIKFEILFYLVGLLYLIFDLEIVIGFFL